MTYTRDELITAQLSHALHDYNAAQTPAKHMAVIRAAAADANRKELLGGARRKMVRPATPAFSESGVSAADVRVMHMARQKQGSTYRYTLRQILELLTEHGLIPDGWTIGQIVAAKRRAEAVSIPQGVWHRELCTLADAGLIEIKTKDKH